MKKLRFSIHIQAPREKVWETVIGKDTYLEWTKAFDPNSGVKGDWSQGSTMRFVATHDGKDEGMLAVIAESRKPEFLSIKHIGYIKDGVEYTESPEVKAWAPAFENYTLKEVTNGTEFIVDLDSEEKYADMFSEMWPKALAKLKELSEK